MFAEYTLTDKLEKRCIDLLLQLGLAQTSEVTSVQPLTGGVASDIARVDLDSRSLCVKFALPKLKVAEDWHAPVHRNAAEYAWLECAATIAPECAVKLYGQVPALHGFAMEYVAGDDVYLWKSALLQHAPDHGEAASVADVLGRIHAHSTRPNFERHCFHNRDDFKALRIDPYLLFSASRHPTLDTILTELAQMLYTSEQVLVHGDVSPKNILFRPTGPLILDAECATMGDASFDPAFCLNHILLKAVHLPHSRTHLLESVSAFWQAYAKHICWESEEVLQARICRLLPALMLARVDGKSPVEYLNDQEQQFVRQIAIDLLLNPVTTLDALVSYITSAMENKTHVSN